MDSADRLDSWKEIAAYLKRGVTTVQRWESEEGLPIHRLAHAKRGSVFAFKSELDAWRIARTKAAAPTGVLASIVATPRTALNRAAVGVAAVLVVALLFSAFERVESATAPQVLRTVPLATDRAHETAPHISPDGRHVVYRWAKPDAPGLYIRSADDNSPRPVPLRGMSGADFPKWSPHGDLIAFLDRETDGRRGVYVVGVDGVPGPRRLASASGIALCWSPDGKSLGYSDRTAPDAPLSVFQVTVTTGARVRLTSPPAGAFGDTHCAFSSTGQLAVSRHFTRFQSDVLVFRSPTDSGRRLTRGGEGIAGLTWTPGDGHIVYGTAAGLMMVATDRTESTPASLVRSGHTLAHPGFSRSSVAGPVHLTYESRAIDVNVWSWSSSSRDPGAFARVASSAGWDDHPDLSSDETRLAFVSNRSGSPELWVANADGSQPTQVTLPGGPPALTPRWSPDGRRLAFTSAVGGNHDVYMAASDGSGLVRLTTEPTQEENPSWSRDGRWIYFRSNRSGIGQIWRRQADGTGTYEQVTHGGASQAFESMDGKTLYFVRGREQAGLWSVPVGGGEEAFLAADVAENRWAVADSGIVFITAPIAAQQAEMRFYHAGRRMVRTIAPIPARGSQIGDGLSANRSGNRGLWTKIDRLDSDVMIAIWRR